MVCTPPAESTVGILGESVKGNARDGQVTKELMTPVLRYSQVWDLRRSRSWENKGWRQRGHREARSVTGAS